LNWAALAQLLQLSLHLIDLALLACSARVCGLRVSVHFKMSPSHKRTCYVFGRYLGVKPSSHRSTSLSNPVALAWLAMMLSLALPGCATESLETERHVKGTPQPDRWKEFLAQAINQFGSAD